MGVASMEHDMEAYKVLCAAFEQGTGGLVEYLGWNKWQALFGFARDEGAALHAETFESWKAMGAWIDTAKL